MPTIFERIQEFNKDRLPEMVKLKYQFMSEDSFRFFRGTCHLFYEDLSKKVNWKDDTKSWICGDLHIENFGTYRGDNRVVYFDLNDFDEGILAPVSWEIVRMLTSIRVAAHVLPLEQEKANELCNDFMDTYIATLQSGKAFAVEKETASGLLKKFLKTVANRSEAELVKERTHQKKTGLMLKIDGQKFLPLPDIIKKSVIKNAGKWLDVHFGKDEVIAHDAAHRIAGTGSVGVKRYVILTESIDDGAFHLIDIKEAKPSSLAPYVNVKQPVWLNEAERVKTLQKRVEYVAPAWLHTIEIDDVYYVVKELQPLEDKMDLTLCKGKTKKLSNILCSMAELAAAGQLRSSGRQGSSITDELIAFANDSSKWRQKVLDYAQKYGQKVLKDYEAYKKELNAAKKVVHAH